MLKKKRSYKLWESTYNYSAVVFDVHFMFLRILFENTNNVIIVGMFIVEIVKK